MVMSSAKECKCVSECVGKGRSYMKMLEGVSERTDPCECTCEVVKQPCIEVSVGVCSVEFLHG